MVANKKIKTMIPRGYSVAREDLAWALAALCQVHRVPFDASLILQQFAPPYSLETLQHAANRLDFQTRYTQTEIAALGALPLPCLAVLRPAAGKQPQGDDSVARVTLAIILRADEDRLLVLEAGMSAPAASPKSEFAERYLGWMLLARPTRDADAPADAGPEKFGYRWFAAALLKYRGVWAEVLAASLVIQLVALATPLFTQVLIDKVIPHQTSNTLVVIAVALGMFMIFGAALTWVRQYLVLHTGNRVDAVLGTHVFEHLFRLPVRYFEHRPTGTLITRIQGVETIREFLSGAAVTLLLDLPFLVTFLAVMFYYSVPLSLICVGVLAAIASLSIAITPVLRRRINQQFLLGARNQAFLTEYVSGMETVKSLQMEPQLASRYGDYLASYLKASFKTRQLSNTYGVVAGGLEQFMTLAILCLGTWFAMTRTDFTIGMLVAFQMFASRLSAPVMWVVGFWQEFQRVNIAVQRLGDIMDAPAEPVSLAPMREARGRGAIAIEGLGFRYADNLPFLYRGLDLRIEPGQCVALMGASGSGKSTLARLLQGFYQPQEGRIRIDERDIRHLSANELRRNFGVVPQETVLFSGTIYDNLVLANPHASFESVVEACKLAEIHDVIEQLPQGYQTPIGEHGVGLSGGQKQRVAIARALLRRPRILVFDEATSGLDDTTAEHFARTINRLRGRVTLLFIAHQLPRRLKVDRVVMLGSDGQEKRFSVLEGDRAQRQSATGSAGGSEPINET